MQWRKYQSRLDPKRLVFIDETWAKTNMTRTHGRALRGERLHAKAPFGKWHTLTFLAALRHDRLDAPWLIDGPINGERFRLYVEQVLVPTLNPGDIVIMDNLGSHKGKAVRRAIRDAGARLLLLPKYSPDLNPIEQVFSISGRRRGELSIQSATPSAKSSTPSPQPNATITSRTPDTAQPKIIRL